MNPQDAQPSVGFNDLVRHLWARRYLLLVIVLACLLSGFLWGRANVGPLYQSTATLLVRTPPTELLEGNRFEPFEPPAFKDFLMSDQALRAVVEAARAEYGAFPQTDYEKIRASFDLQIVMTRETAVQVIYSPVIKMTVDWPNPEIAHFLMNQWVDLALERYGMLRVREAQKMREAAESVYNKLVADIAELDGRQARLDQQIANLTAQLEARNQLLSGSGTFNRDDYSGGLLHQRAKARLAGAGNVAAIEQTIAETQAEIEQLSDRRAQLQTELAAVRETLVTARLQAADMRTVYTGALVEATAVPETFGDQPTGDLSVLSPPSMPESRINSRAIVMAAVALGLFAIAMMALLLELLVRRIVYNR